MRNDTMARNISCVIYLGLGCCEWVNMRFTD